MRFCNYGRKSVFSEKSDSIDNQFRMSKDYVDARFSGQIESWVQYYDEDFTGANTKRPDLMRMIDDIKAGLYDALVVYQLDRLSRDVKDFANIYALLEEHHVMFISIKENIDTTTPIGRAMMYVTVVFAQMERETIAARVTDNLVGLAKKGYWAGGNPPVGYVRKRIVVGGKQHVTIVPDPDGAKYVNWIFDSFLDNDYSLQSMETAFKQKGIRTRSGAFFSTNQLYKILSSPYCVEATKEIYDYYSSKGCFIDPGSPREKWDGSVGVMVYGRSTQKNKKHELQPPEKWIVCLGIHKPFIPADKWLKVQSRFSRNKFDKTMKYDIPLLKGVLRCSCGSIMQVSRRKKVSGDVSSWYYCIKRSRKGPEVCDSHHIKCEKLDQKVLDIMRSIDADPKLVKEYVADNSDFPQHETPKSLDAKIVSIESKISRIASSLVYAEGSSAQKYIVAEMERLDLELQALKRERNAAVSALRQRNASLKSAEEKVDDIRKLINGFDSFSPKEKNDIIRSVIKQCTWDGESLFISL